MGIFKYFSYNPETKKYIKILRYGFGNHSKLAKINFFLVKD